MSKSIIVVDTPECCEMCYFSLQVEAGSYCLPSRIHGQRMVNAMFGTKLERCPLKEMPKELAPGISEEYIEYCQGFNDCIHAILGENNYD